jgi:DNA polymerase elongation subunit (family B)
MISESSIIFDTEIKTNDNLPNPFSPENPIIMISCLFNLNNSNHINIFTTLNLTSTFHNAKIIKCTSELQLIYFFYHYVISNKPTFLIGYNICGLDFNFIRSRLFYLSNLYNKPIEKKLTEKFNLIWIEQKNEINLSNNKKLNTFICAEKYYKFPNIQIIDLAILSKKKIKLNNLNITNLINHCINANYQIPNTKIFIDIILNNSNQQINQNNSESLINCQIELLTNLKKVYDYLISLS